MGIVFALAFWPDASGMLVLWQQGMPLYLLHTTILVCGAVALSLLIGLPAAWVMAISLYTSFGHFLNRMLRTP
ncbi:hypothetical protein ACWWJF_14800 [Symbiopectobacterium sp. Eva_TO]